jgi:hypothetical protein
MYSRYSDVHELTPRCTSLTFLEECPTLTPLADRGSFKMNGLALRIWRNWQTRYFEVVVE